MPFLWTAFREPQRKPHKKLNVVGFSEKLVHSELNRMNLKSKKITCIFDFFKDLVKGVETFLEGR